MAFSYDLVVIGTGTAASVAAKRCREAGWSVAVIDDRPFGGTCAQRGCDPKKVLLGAAAGADRVRKLSGKGLSYADLKINWPELVAFKRSFTDPVPSMKEESFEKLGIAAFHGHARLTGKNAVEVNGDSLIGRHVLLATGAKPAPLGIAGEEHLATSDVFMELDRLPRRIVMAVGGYIAFEFAHLARRVGAEVTVVEKGARFLAAFEPELVDWLVERSAKLGINFHSNTEIEAVEPADDGFLVHAVSEKGTSSFAADLVVHAAGRVPALDPRDLDAAGVSHDNGRLDLNRFLQSRSNPQVYAAGDAAQVGPPLTPVASREAAVAAENMLQGNNSEVDYGAVPSAVFTVPPLAAVGLREEQAEEKGLDFTVNCEDTTDWYANRRVNEPAGGYKILVERGSNRILGAHLLGPGADELVNVFALAIAQGVSAEDLRGTLFAYPTAASYLGSMLTR